MRSYVLPAFSLLLFFVQGCLEPVTPIRDESINRVDFRYAGTVSGDFQTHGEFLRELGGDGVEALLKENGKVLTLFAIEQAVGGKAYVLDVSLDSEAPLRAGDSVAASDQKTILSVDMVFNEIYNTNKPDIFYSIIDGGVKLDVLTEDSVQGVFRGRLFNSKTSGTVTIDSGYFSSRIRDVD
jgi:hypothetical protein